MKIKKYGERDENMSKDKYDFDNNIDEREFNNEGVNSGNQSSENDGVRNIKVSKINDNVVRKINISHIKDDVVRKINVAHLDEKCDDTKIDWKLEKNSEIDNNKILHKEYPMDNSSGIKTAAHCNDIIFSKKNNIISKKQKLFHDNGQGNITKDNTILEEYKHDRKNNPYILSKLVQERVDFIYYMNALYYYERPIYRRLNEHEAKTLIRKVLPKNIISCLNDYELTGIIKLIETDPDIQKDEDDIKMKDNLICFRNGVYNYESNILKEHSKKYYFFNFVDADFDPESDSTGDKFNAYLDSCSGGDIELKKLITEVIGYIISNSMAAKKIFIIYGVPDSGKTTFAEFLNKLLGSENCCHVALQDLNKRFQVSELCGKKLCSNMDIPNTIIKDTSLLKQLSGNDLITAERKYENLFSFKNQCKLLYGCNSMPKVQNVENELAFINRLIIIPFKYIVPPEKQDKELVKNLLKERNYIITIALKAFKKVVENNYQFSKCKAFNEIRASYIRANNNIIDFVHSKCVLKKGEYTFSKDLYSNYIKYCNECLL